MKIERIDQSTLRVDGKDYAVPTSHKFFPGKFLNIPERLPGQIDLVYKNEFALNFWYIYEINPRQITLNYENFDYRISIPWTYFIVKNGSMYVVVSAKQVHSIKELESASYYFFPNADDCGICFGEAEIARNLGEDIHRFHSRQIISFFTSKFNNDLGSFPSFLENHNELNLGKICSLSPLEVCEYIDESDISYILPVEITEKSFAAKIADKYTLKQKKLPSVVAKAKEAKNVKLTKKKSSRKEII